ncbi:O-fucosyltransferase family protein [Mucilaginibacter sp.]
MTKKKSITVIPSGGLGNRMRVISSCVNIAKTDQRELVIAWPNNSELGCEITDIFKSIGLNYKIPSKLNYFILVQLYRHGAVKKFYRLYKFFSKLFFDKTVFDNDTEFNRPEISENDDAILVSTCFAFRDLDLTQFKFIDHLNKKTDEFYNLIGGDYIGIHVRRTDHSAIIKLSPLENYLLQIDKCILNNPQQKFYLATDDINTKNLLVEKYGERLYTSDHKLSRENLEGIHGAVIELLLLSKATHIICSSMSSYSDTAILIGNINNVIFV